MATAESIRSLFRSRVLHLALPLLQLLPLLMLMLMHLFLLFLLLQF